MAQYPEPKDYPKNKFPKVIDGIDNFQKNSKDFLTDLFCLILIFSKRRPRCKSVYDAHSIIKSFLPLNTLNSQGKSKIANLITNYLGAKQTNNFIQCNCGYKGYLIEETEFYNTPNYLIVDLGESSKIVFDTQISLSDHTEMAKRYKLYAAINKCGDNNSDAKYVCLISEKEEGQEIWKYYEGNLIEKSGNEGLEMGTPSCAIYKKL